MRSIALDVGTKKIGIAITDWDKKFITILPKIDICNKNAHFYNKNTSYNKSDSDINFVPMEIHSTTPYSKFQFDAKRVFNLLKEKLSSYWDEIDQIIIGNSEDSEYENNDRIVNCQKQLQRVLKSYTSWEIFEESEVYTSVEGFKILKNLSSSPKQIKKNIDSCAAAIMLSNFFFNKGRDLVMGF